METKKVPDQKTEIIKVKDELIAVYEKFAAYRKEKERELDYANDCYLREAEKSSRLQHQVDTLETEIGTLRNQIAACENHTTIVELKKTIDQVENELVFTQGSLVKEISRNGKKDSQFQNMKKNLTKLNETLLGEVEEKESLVATISDLDEKVDTWKTKYEKCKEQCDVLQMELKNFGKGKLGKSGSNIYESDILRSAKNSGIQLLNNNGGQEPNSASQQSNNGEQLKNNAGQLPALKGQLPSNCSQTSNTSALLPNLGSQLRNKVGQLPNLGDQLAKIGGQLAINCDQRPISSVPLPSIHQNTNHQLAPLEPKAQPLCPSPPKQEKPPTGAVRRIKSRIKSGTKKDQAAWFIEC